MDITFSCEKCGQNIVVDEAGAGITVDCPKCGKPVYVPSSAPLTEKDGPVRIEMPFAKPMPPAAPIPPVPSRPVGLSYGSTSNIEHRTPNVEQGVHPSIVASLRCLIIGAVLLFGALIAMHQDFTLTPVLSSMATPFLVAALLCAVYGMCIGQVNQGLLLVAGLSLILGLFFWVYFRAIPSPTDVQRQIEQQMRQFPQFPH